jgi:hypothetical protein
MQNYRLAPHPTTRQRQPLHMQAAPTQKPKNPDRERNK